MLLDLRLGQLPISHLPSPLTPSKTLAVNNAAFSTGAYQCLLKVLPPRALSAKCVLFLVDQSSAVTRNRLHCQIFTQCTKCLGRDAEGTSGPESLIFDEQSLEAELKNAIETENYTQAARLRDELHMLQENNKAGILAANAKFYKAFEKGDLSAMRTLWSKEDNAHCIHPGAGCISGYDLIMESWELTFGPELDLPLQIDIQNVELCVKGNLGFVTCLELVRTSGNNWGKQVATNIFEKVDGNWYMCLHHASHIAP